MTNEKLSQAAAIMQFDQKLIGMSKANDDYLYDVTKETIDEDENNKLMKRKSNKYFQTKFKIFPENV